MQRRPRGFMNALSSRRFPPATTRLIAEIKKASPSKGSDPRRFRSAGSCQGLCGRAARPALSVLTDTPSFQGQPAIFWAPSAKRPSLFPSCARIFSTIPIRSTRRGSWGADCILIIMASGVDDDRACEGTGGNRLRTRHGCAGRSHMMKQNLSARSSPEVQPARHQQPQSEHVRDDALETSERLAPRRSRRRISAGRRSGPVHAGRSVALNGRTVGINDLPDRRKPDAPGRRRGGNPRAS